MNIEGINLLKQSEGLKLKPYLDGGNKPTIGWGNTFYEDSTRVKLTDSPITKERADKLLYNISYGFYKEVKKLVKVPVSENELSALTSLAYNIGIRAFKGSTLLIKINNNSDFSEIEKSWLSWKYDNGKVVKGLLNRRFKELELFKKKTLKINKMEKFEKFFKEQKQKIFVVACLIVSIVLIKKFAKK